MKKLLAAIALLILCAACESADARRARLERERAAWDNMQRAANRRADVFLQELGMPHANRSCSVEDWNHGRWFATCVVTADGQVVIPRLECGSWQTRCEIPEPPKPDTSNEAAAAMAGAAAGYLLRGN